MPVQRVLEMLVKRTSEVPAERVLKILEQRAAELLVEA